MYFAKVYVTYKESVLDPQGQAVGNAVERLGFEGIKEVRMGKYFEIKLHAQSKEEAKTKMDAICDKLLANPNMEQYRYEITNGEG